MARGRTPKDDDTATPALTAPGADADLPDQEIADQLEALTASLGGAVAGCSVHVYRRRSDRNRIARCKRIPLEDFDVDQLPLMFGGGEYCLRLVDGDGKAIRVFRVLFDPDLYPDVGAAGPRAPGAPPVAAAAAQLAPAPAPYDPTAARLAALEQSLEAERTRHAAFLESIVTATLKGGAGGGSLREQLESFKLIAELVAPRQAVTPASEIAEAMRSAIEITKELRGDGAGESGGDGIMGKVAEGLMSMIAARAAAPPAPEPPRAFPRPVSPPPPAAAPPVPAPSIGLMPSAPAAPPATVPVPAAAAPAELPAEWAPFAFLRQYTGQAIEMARSNIAPELVGQLIYQAVPDAQLDALTRFVQLPDQERAAVLVALDPRLDPYAAYMHLVAAAVREEIEAEHAADGTGQ